MNKKLMNLKIGSYIDDYDLSPYDAKIIIIHIKDRLNKGFDGSILELVESSVKAIMAYKSSVLRYYFTDDQFIEEEKKWLV